MAQTLERGRPIKGEKQPDVVKRIPEKKSYFSPRLLEYGSIAKLTQTAPGSGADAALMMPPCL